MIIAQKYSISKYIIFPLNEYEVVIQNQQGIVKIHDIAMIQLLKEWDSKKTLETTTEELESMFSNDTEEAIQFLQSYGIIDEVKPKMIDIDKISIVSNNYKVGQLLSEIIKQDYGMQLPVAYHTMDTLPEVQESELLIGFLSPYSKKLGRKIKSRQLQKENSKLLLSYIYNNNFYIDCLYSPEWKVPCHECYIGYIEAQSYLEERSNVTYQQMINALYSQTDDFMIEVPLSSVQKINIVRLLVNKINKYLNNLNTTLTHKEQVTSCTLFDLAL